MTAATTRCIPARLLAAQARVDDGTATAADRAAVAELDALLAPSVDRIRALEHAADLACWRRWHDEHCDDDEPCNHYEPVEG